MVYFTPPGRSEHRGTHPLFGRLLFTQGVSLLKESGLYRQASNPTDEELDAAEVAYLGGYRYDVDATEASDLIAAGYGAWLEGSTSSAYGFGPYGTGAYGGVG